MTFDALHLTCRRARQRKAKHAALAGQALACHTHLAAQFFHDAADDRQPQPVSLRPHQVEPRKWGEQPHERFRRYAIAIVLDPKARMTIGQGLSAKLQSRWPSTRNSE